MTVSSPVDLAPFALSLDIVYEDSDLIVINKPSGLVVHPAAGHHNDTLVNALLHYTKDLARGLTSGRPGIVHRIDKETSGLLVVAKNDATLTGLAAQFKNKSVHRIYWAVVHGHLRNKSGTIKSYLRRHPTQRKKFASEKLTPGQSPKGKLAITHYEVQQLHPSGFSLLHCTLETGRTHQIRVHLSEMGHPIVADPIYGLKNRAKAKSSPHLMLHAAELGFIHPRLKKEMKFTTPWPAETEPFLAELQFL